MAPQTKPKLIIDNERGIEPDDKSAPLLDHLVELRQRLLVILGVFGVAFLGAYYWSDALFSFLVKPLVQLLPPESGRKLIYTGLTEAFTTYLKVAFFFAAFISFPLVANQVWKFIAPGLYRHEKKLYRPVFAATPILFLMGAAFAYYLVLPAAWKFFLSFETAGGPGTLPIQLEARMNEYLSLVMHLMLVFGMSFQLPLILIVLSRTGIVNATMLATKRKYAFLLIMIVAAIITPPDLISMIALGLPLYFLYEASIFIVRQIEKNSVSSTVYSKNFKNSGS